MTAPAVLPETPHARAVELHYAGTPMSLIIEQTGLTRDQVLDAVDRDVHVRPAPRGHTAPAARAVPARATAATPAAPEAAAAAPEASEPAPESGTVIELLAWAARHDDTRIRTTARRVREGIDELRHRRAGEQEAREAAAEVERLAAELDAAKARARAAGISVGRRRTTAPEPPHTDARDATDAQIRAWATSTGRPVVRYGRVPQNLRDAYAAAHATQAARA